MAIPRVWKVFYQVCPMAGPETSKLQTGAARAEESSAIRAALPEESAETVGAGLRFPPTTGNSRTMNSPSDAAKRMNAGIKEGRFDVAQLQAALKRGEDLSGLDLSALPAGALTNVALEGGKLSRAVLPKTLGGVTFKDIDLSGADFSGAVLERVTFSGQTSLVGADFRGATINNASFGRGLAYGDTRFDGAYLKASNFRHGYINEGAVFNEAKLAGVDFTGARLFCAQFRGAVLERVSFRDADLRRAKFEYAPGRSQGPEGEGCEIFIPALDLGPTLLTPQPARVPSVRAQASGCGFDRADLRGAETGAIELKAPNTFRGALYQDFQNFSALNLPSAASMRKAPTDFGQAPPPEDLWRSAVEGSRVSLIRQGLNELGKEARLHLDGRGRHIAVVDGVLKDGGKTVPQEHGAVIEQVMRELAPRVKIDFFSSAGRAEPAAQKVRPVSDDTEAALNLEIEATATRFVNSAAFSLEQVASADVVYDAVNLSNGVSAARIAEWVRDWLNQPDLSSLEAAGAPLPQGGMFAAMENCPFLRPKMRALVLGGAQGPGEQYRAVLRYTESRLARGQSQKLEAALARYDEAVDKLWEKNTAVIVSMGNEGYIYEKKMPSGSESFAEPLDPADGASANILVRPHTIGVASAHTNRTPANLKDDRVSPFSSWGTSSRAPTVTAPGEIFALSDVQRGTSFSAPHVAATAALLRQIEPDLSPDDFAELISLTAVDTSAPHGQEGAGMIDPVSAARVLWSSVQEGKSASSLPLGRVKQEK